MSSNPSGESHHPSNPSNGLYQGSVTLIHEVDDMSPNDFNYTQSPLLSDLTSPSQQNFKLNTMKLLENYNELMAASHDEYLDDENHNESLEELVTNNESL